MRIRSGRGEVILFFIIIIGVIVLASGLYVSSLMLNLYENDFFMFLAVTAFLMLIGGSLYSSKKEFLKTLGNLFFCLLGLTYFFLVLKSCINSTH